MRTRPISALLGAVAVALSVALASAGDEPAPPPPPADTSRLVTLHRGDPIAHALDLRDGSFGARLEGARFVEGRAHLDYGNYRDDSLTLALEEDDRGILLDLGHWADLAKAYDFEEAVGGGVGFGSLSFSEGEFRIARRLPRDSFQNLREGRALLTAAAGERQVSAAPVVGHVLLARVQDRHRKDAPTFAKILVVSHMPGDHVTIRWDRIPGL